MNLKELIAGDVDVFFDVNGFGEQIKYNGSAIVGKVEIGQANQSGNGFTNEGMSDGAVIKVKITDVPEPLQGDEIVACEKTWEMARVITGNSISWTLQCIASESALRL